MLIIPMERTWEFKGGRLPWVTWTLILINLVVFLTANSKDSHYFEEAISQYQTLEIWQKEEPWLNKYRQQPGNDFDELDYPYEELQWDPYLSYWLLTNDDYQGWVNRTLTPLHQEFPTLAMYQFDPELYEESPEERYLWLSYGGIEAADVQQLRDYLTLEYYSYQQIDQFNELLDLFLLNNQKQAIAHLYLSQLSAQKYGLTPAEPNLINAFTYMFMHGGFMHLLGNMVMLLLVGMTLEMLLGKTNYLLFYIVTGLVSGLGFALLNWGSSTPLVGASGAIAAVLGMYVAAYGTKKIRFFGFFVVYFNYFHAYALIMLPVWVGKELVQAMIADTNVAYSAHAIGLVSGALLVWLGKNTFARIDEQELENSEADPKKYREKLDSAMRSLWSLEFDQAKVKFIKLANQFPEQFEPYYQLTNLYSLTPKALEFEQYSNRYLSLLLRQSVLEEVALDHLQRLEPALKEIKFTDEVLMKLLHRLIKQDRAALAEALFKGQVPHHNPPSKAFKDGALMMLKRHSKNEDKAQFY